MHAGIHTVFRVDWLPYFMPYFVMPWLASVEEYAAEFEGAKGFQPQTPKKWPRPFGPKRGPSADDLGRQRHGAWGKAP